jgi:hypothetical protein
MTEAEWLAFDETEQRAALVGIASERKLRLFVAACLRDALPAVSTPDCREIVAMNEEWAEHPFPDAKWLDRRRSVRRSSELEASFVERVLHAGLHPDPGSAAAGTAWSSAVLLACTGTGSGWTPIWTDQWSETRNSTAQRQYQFACDIFGNSLRPVLFAPEWRTDTAVALARTMYESRDFSAMPLLADALQDAGCDTEDVLNHCREPGEHMRGCWVVDAVLNKE